MTRARRAAAGVVASLFGLGLLIWQVQSVGLEAIRDGLSRVGWGFASILALSLVRFALRSLAWTTIIGERVPLPRALAATLSGDALGNLTPLSLIVSEPAKSLYLRDQLPVARSFAALAAENFFYAISVALFILAGTVALLETFTISPEVRLAARLSLGIMAAVLAAALWIVWRRPALASRSLAHLPLHLDRWVERVRDFEIRTYQLVRQTRGRLAIVAACETGFHLVSFLESYVAVWLLTGQSAPLAAFVLDTFNRIVNVVFRMVPLGRVGVDEWTTRIVAEAVGLLPATGVTLALLRKGRILFWTAIGLVLSIQKGMTIRQALAAEGSGGPVPEEPTDE